MFACHGIRLVTNKTPQPGIPQPHRSLHSYRTPSKAQPAFSAGMPVTSTVISPALPSVCTTATQVAAGSRQAVDTGYRQVQKEGLAPPFLLPPPGNTRLVGSTFSCGAAWLTQWVPPHCHHPVHVVVHHIRQAISSFQNTRGRSWGQEPVPSHSPCIGHNGIGSSTTTPLGQHSQEAAGACSSRFIINTYHVCVQVYTYIGSTSLPLMVAGMHVVNHCL